MSEPVRTAICLFLDETRSLSNSLSEFSIVCAMKSDAAIAMPAGAQ